MKVGKVFKRIAVDDDAIDVVMPLELEGKLPKGTFVRTQRLKSIIWSPNLNEKISPGVIPDMFISLFLPKNHIHDLSSISSKVMLYVHRDNIFTVPCDRPFMIWNENPIISLPGILVESVIDKQAYEFVTKANASGPTYCVKGIRLSSSGSQKINGVDTNAFDQLLEQSSRINPYWHYFQNKSRWDPHPSTLQAYAEQNLERISKKLYVDIMKEAETGKLQKFEKQYGLKPSAHYVDIKRVIEGLRTAYPSLTIRCGGFLNNIWVWCK